MSYTTHRQENNSTKHSISLGFALFLQKTKSNQFYKNQLQPIFAEYMRALNIPTRYSVFEVTSHLRKYNMVTFLKGKMLLKPIILGAGNHVFSVPRIKEGVREYFVCLVCNRGFDTKSGMIQHRLSEGHRKNIHKLKERLDARRDGTWQCPVMQCDQLANTEEEMEFHLDRGSHQQTIECIPIYDQLNGLANGYSDTDSGYPCLMCRVTCNSQRSLDAHKAGKKHRLCEFKIGYRRNRQNMIRDKKGIVIKPVLQPADKAIFADGVLSLTTDRDRVIAEFKVINQHHFEITFHACTQYGFTSGVTIDDIEGVAQSSRNAFELSGGEKYVVNVKVEGLLQGNTRIPLMFTFKELDGEVFNIVKELLVHRVINAELCSYLQPVQPYAGPKKITVARGPFVDVQGEKPTFIKDDGLKFVKPLEYYNVPSDIRSAMESDSKKSKASFMRKHQLEHLDDSTYSAHFNALLYLEELQMDKDIAMYTMEEAILHTDSRSRLLRLEVPGLAENRPSVLRGDKLFAYTVPPDGHRYEGYVHHVGRDDVKLGFGPRLLSKHIKGMKYRIEFTVNRLPMRLEHRAACLAGLPQTDLLYTLFPDTDRLMGDMVTVDRLRFFDEHVESNPEQKRAVEQMVKGTSRPAPYLVFGPPGTGKTVTVVEAIKQVNAIFRKRDCHILACAPQNNAADLLAERLLAHVDKGDIIRLNASSRSMNDIVTQKVKDVSNYKSSEPNGIRAANYLLPGRSRQDVGMQAFFPPIDVLKKYKIIVCTLVTAGRLASAGMESHFSHIFIDEAGHATEPETTIALAGILDVNQKFGGQLVLAGDPKQLGPIIRSRLAEKCGLGMSLLERLMSNVKAYERQASGSYDDRVVTKLLKSFRSHPEIFSVPNHCFYDDELQTRADKMEREKFCRWEGLPKKDFPLIFHGVSGKDEREENSPSWFNIAEVDLVIDYVQRLVEMKNPKVKAEHIGIISPYRKQVDKIKRGLSAANRKSIGVDRRLTDIKVGSVEVFQGEERPIIIISTVRSTDDYLVDDAKFSLGFVKNPKRFNVAITRAKSLLIVIGNPALLCLEDHWQEFITFCHDNGGYTGCPPPDDDMGLPDELAAQMAALKLQEKADITLEVSDYQQQVDPGWQRRD